MALDHPAVDRQALLDLSMEVLDERVEIGQMTQSRRQQEPRMRTDPSRERVHQSIMLAAQLPAGI